MKTIRKHNIFKTTVFLFSAIFFCIIFCFESASTCMAEVIYDNPDTSYKVSIEDDADLLSPDEESRLGEQMKEITAYGNVGFVSIDYNYDSTEDFARTHYRQLFGYDSGTLFVIDMDNRNIWIFSDGDIYKTITDSYADTITDNVYTYASDEKYFDCASNAYTQISTLLSGRKIAQPMKYISNALLAMILALLINYFIVRAFSHARKPSENEILNSIYTQCHIDNPTCDFLRQTKTFSPQSSDSSDSGGGGSSGGGGGSSSGGGGGHSF